jgi:hypothetical protein
LGNNIRLFCYIRENIFYKNFRYWILVLEKLF